MLIFSSMAVGTVGATTTSTSMDLSNLNILGFMKLIQEGRLDTADVCDCFYPLDDLLEGDELAQDTDAVDRHSLKKVLDNDLVDLVYFLKDVDWPGVVVALAGGRDIAVNILYSSSNHQSFDGDIVADQDEGMYIVEMMVGIDTVDTVVAVDVVNTPVEGTGDNMASLGEEGMPVVHIEDENNEKMPNDYSSLYHQPCFYCNLVGVVVY